MAAVSILSLHMFARCGGSEGRRLLFSEQDTIKIYEDLVMNPGELVRLQGPVGLYRFLWGIVVSCLCEFQEYQGFSYSNIRTKNTFQSLFRFSLFRLLPSM